MQMPELSFTAEYRALQMKLQKLLQKDASNMTPMPTAITMTTVKRDVDAENMKNTTTDVAANMLIIF